MKEFAGYTVPNLTSEDFDGCVYVFNRNNSEVFCSYLGIGRCANSNCSECILCANVGNAELKRQTFIAYAETKGYVFRDGKLVKKIPSGMPELKPGMVVQTNSGAYSLCINSIYGYKLQPHYNHYFTNEIYLDKCYPLVRCEIVAVFGNTDGTPLMTESIKGIVFGKENARLLWKKSEAPRKLTVKEVAKKLGYPVEIVAEEEK